MRIEGPPFGQMNPETHDVKDGAVPALQEKNKQGDKGGQKQKAKGAGGKDASPGFFSFKIPRPTEGIIARRSALVILGFLWFLGGFQLYSFLESYPTWGRAWGGAAVPLLQLPLNFALLTSVGLFAVGSMLSFFTLNRTTSVDFLVDTEIEMKKVTWPTKSDSVNATLVVIATVLVMGALLAIFDFLLRVIFGVIY